MYSRYYEFNEKEAAYKVGCLFKKDVQSIKPAYIPKELTDCLNKVKKELPKIYEEIKQSALGAEITIEEMFGIMAYEFYEDPFSFDHCTDVTKIINGRVLKGHNEDLNGNKTNTAIIKRNTENGWYTEIAYMDCIAGSTVFYNSYGLLVSGNYIYNKDYNFNHYPTSIILRLFVECGSIEEMEEVLKKYPPMSSFNLNVYNRNNNKAYNLEFTPNKIDIFEVEDLSIHTNHLLYTQDDTDKIDQPSSMFRLKKSRELENENGIETIEDIQAILEYEGEDYYSSIHKKAYKDNALTVMMLLYDSQKKEIILEDYVINETFREYW